MTIYADALPSTLTVRCVFGAASATPLSISRYELVCISPGNSPGTADLHLQISRLHPVEAPAAQYNSLVATASYEYLREAQVHSVRPSSGPVFGGAAVTVLGRHFVRRDTLLQCQYGHLIMLATYINSSTVVCRAPRHAASRVSLELTLNGQDFTTNGVMYDFTAFRITHLFPTRGMVAGGTNVMVYLDSQVDASRFYCRFGTAPLVTATRSPRETRLQCRAPSHPTGRVQVTLLAFPDNSSASAEFEFVREPGLLSIMPAQGLTAALTPVFVYGTNFVNSSALTCAFGSARTNATFIDNRTALCVAPYYLGTEDDARLPVSYSHPNTVFQLLAPLDHALFNPTQSCSTQVRISTNALDFSRSDAVFEYIACPRGAWCPQLQVMPCPPGAFCTSRGGTNFTACPPGTFRSEGGHTRCNPCPFGHYCPAQGMAAPLLCAAGMVCSLPGLAFPDTFCPPGHYCPLGVSTSDPNSNTSTQSPRECPENTWCPAGVASNVSIPGNHSTPQPCLAGFVCFRGSDNPQGSGPCPTGYFCPPGVLAPAPSAHLNTEADCCLGCAAPPQARCRLSVHEQITVLVWATYFRRSVPLASITTGPVATSASNVQLATSATRCDAFCV